MKPLILITNDDGIYSPGLLAVAEAVSDLGELLVCAPRYQQTCMGRSFPRTDDLGIIEEVPLHVNGKEIMAFGVHGSPAFSVAHAVLELSDRLPDLCISGINYGENLGLVLSCSGTIGAALEAQSHGIPAIAVSKQVDLWMQRLNDFVELNWDIEKQITRKMAEHVLQKGMPANISIFNINVPSSVASADDYLFTRQSHQNYFPFNKPPLRSFNEPYQMSARLAVDEASLEKDSDIHAVHVQQKISITPIHWDMTAEKALHTCQAELL